MISFSLSSSITILTNSNWFKIVQYSIIIRCTINTMIEYPYPISQCSTEQICTFIHINWYRCIDSASLVPTPGPIIVFQCLLKFPTFAIVGFYLHSSDKLPLKVFEFFKNTYCINYWIRSTLKVTGFATYTNGPWNKMK